MNKKAIVIHSGGMDSSICLAVAIREFGVENVESLSFSYEQRHPTELIAASKICLDWGVDHTVITVDVLRQVTTNALMDRSIPIEQQPGLPPNTLVLGRNGLMARLGAIYAHHKGASIIYMGVIEVEAANSGYRDCSRQYMDLMQEVLRMDLADSSFEIRTPVSQMTKAETLALADSLSKLDYLLENTVTCYEGISGRGCEICPACKLRNEGIETYFKRRTVAVIS